MNTQAQATRVYSGKRGCMCGCKGSYRCNAAWAAVEPDDADDINETQVRKVTTMVDHQDSMFPVDRGGGMFNETFKAMDVQTGGSGDGFRTYAVYHKVAA